MYIRTLFVVIATFFASTIASASNPLCNNNTIILGVPKDGENLVNITAQVCATPTKPMSGCEKSSWNLFYQQVKPGMLKVAQFRQDNKLALAHADMYGVANPDGFNTQEEYIKVSSAALESAGSKVAAFCRNSAPLDLTSEVATINNATTKMLALIKYRIKEGNLLRDL